MENIKVGDYVRLLSYPEFQSKDFASLKVESMYALINQVTKVAEIDANDPNNTYYWIGPVFYDIKTNKSVRYNIAALYLCVLKENLEPANLNKKDTLNIERLIQWNRKKYGANNSFI